MTSNVGAQTINKTKSLGFGNDEEGLSYKEMKARVQSELRKIFRPELLNRIDETIVFHKLEREDMRHIIEIQVKRLRQQMAERDVSVEFTKAALDKLSDAGYDPAYGARPLRRVLQRMIEDPMSEMILKRRNPRRLEGDHRGQRNLQRGGGRGRVHRGHPGLPAYRGRQSRVRKA